MHIKELPSLSFITVHLIKTSSFSPPRTSPHSRESILQPHHASTSNPCANHVWTPLLKPCPNPRCGTGKTLPFRREESQFASEWGLPETHALPLPSLRRGIFFAGWEEFLRRSFVEIKLFSSRYPQRGSRESFISSQVISGCGVRPKKPRENNFKSPVGTTNPPEPRPSQGQATGSREAYFPLSRQPAKWKICFPISFESKALSGCEISPGVFFVLVAW
jgi:hypothetical protein